MKIYFHLSLDGFSNCYVVTNEETMEAVIIDPGIITKEILEQVEGGPFSLSAVLVTHNHASHVRGIATLKRIYTPKVYAADYDLAGSEETILKGDGTVQIAGMSVGYMAVPGHTSDSLAYKIGTAIFTGDAITTGIVGDTTSSYAHRTLVSNLRAKILSQQDDFILMPGHGPPVSVAAEREFNPEFREKPPRII